jgi:phage terminase small subunit
MPKLLGLTLKQRKFAAEYIVDLSGYRAAIRAGYPASRARQTASELLANPDVRAEIAELQAEVMERTRSSAEAVIEGLQRIAFFDSARVFDQSGNLIHPRDWPERDRMALSSFDVVIRNVSAGDGIQDKVAKVKLADRLAALELLAKHHGLMIEKQQIDQTMTITWMPPEPPPETSEVIEAGPPLALTGHVETDRPTQVEMGLAGPAGGPPNRTHPSRFSDSPLPSFTDQLQGKPSSSVSFGQSEEEIALAVERSGLSRRAQERMFPELRRKG